VGDPLAGISTSSLAVHCLGLAAISGLSINNYLLCFDARPRGPSYIPQDGYQQVFGSDDGWRTNSTLTDFLTDNSNQRDV